MTINPLYSLRKNKDKSLEIKLSELKTYEIVLKYPNKIKRGDIVLNAGLTSEILPEIYKGRFTTRFLSGILSLTKHKN